MNNIASINHIYQYFQLMSKHQNSNFTSGLSVVISVIASSVYVDYGRADNCSSVVLLTISFAMA